MQHLNELEEKSIYIIRESYFHFRNQMAMLWSIGKDSTVMLWLVRKAFAGKVPFPLVHIDTTYKIPEMITFRDQMVVNTQLDMIIGSNTNAVLNKQTFPDHTISRLDCCHSLKTQALQNTVQGTWPRLRFNHSQKKYETDSKNECFNALLMGIRSDEEGSRSKERYFSVRNEDSTWNIENMPAELWDEFNVDLKPNQSVRVHPLLDWTEKNIWEYIVQENIEVTSLYFNQGDEMRYRSLGCAPCTKKITSHARNAKEVLTEISSGQYSKIAERSGREQDKENGMTLEKLRRKGYM